MAERPVQTRVKHEILEDYLTRWGGIILNGLRQAYQRTAAKDKWITRLVYVDCFAFEGRYDENGAEVYGSPIIGIRALDNHRETAIGRVGFTPQTVAILFEEKRSTYNILLDTLNRLGYGTRLRDETNFSRLRSGDITVIYGDYREYAQSLLAFSGSRYTWAFYLLDPYGPSGIPLNIVAPIIAQEHADVMINFPIYEIYKKGGSVRRGTPSHASHIEHINAMFGSEAWQLMADEYEGEPLEQQYANNYRQVMEQQDRDLAVKMIPLRFQDIEKKGYYLVLTTHDGTGGLVMNEILDSARISEYDHRMQRRRTKGGQFTMSFVEELQDVARPSLEQADISEVAQEILQHCRGETLPYRDILRRMVNSPYYPDDLKEAMNYLRSGRQVKFETPLRNDRIITFR